MNTPRHFLKLGALLCLGWAAVGCGNAPTDSTTPGPSAEPAPTGTPGVTPPSASPAPSSPTAPTPTAPAPAPSTGTTAPTPAPSTGTTAPAPQPSGTQLDADGVVMLMPANTAGSAWALGSGDPNSQGQYFDLDGDTATKSTEGGITYWTDTGHKVTYASGAPDGRTIRLNIRAGGGSQQYTWKSGALEHGYLASPKDLKNFEATAYVRVRGYNGTHTSMNWKLRGGRHSSSDGSLASCVEMGVPYGGGKPGGARELDHPNYDQFSLTPQFPYQLEEGKWLAVKVVTYLVPGGTQNRLYLDTDPFDASGKPRNAFRLFTEWMDKDGQSTGRYTQAATWAGWVTTFRVDGWQALDFAILSAREILPPQS